MSQAIVPDGSNPHQQKRSSLLFKNTRGITFGCAAISCLQGRGVGKNTPRRDVKGCQGVASRTKTYPNNVPAKGQVLQCLEHRASSGGQPRIFGSKYNPGLQTLLHLKESRVNPKKQDKEPKALENEASKRFQWTRQYDHFAFFLPLVGPKATFGLRLAQVRSLKPKDVPP